MFAISPTDRNWFTQLKDSGFNSYVNFWTPTPWNIKNPKVGDRWYFLLKAPIRKIAGYGELVQYQNMTPFEAWKYYGLRNGCKNIEELRFRIQSYIDKHSEKFKNQKININTYDIGCIILKNCQFWDEEQYIDPEDFGIHIADQVVTRKNFNQYDPFITNNNSLEFQLLNEPRDDYKTLTNQRKGQGKFKGEILKAYNNKCCISGEICPELLDAAHIQIYLNEYSNHTQNGILLRTDLHRLFDNGLLYIDSNYFVHISSLIKSTIYQQYNNTRISLPDNINDYPSIHALELKLKGFRK